MLLRDGMAQLLQEYGIEVVAQTGDAGELITKVRAHLPDVAVTDVAVRNGKIEDGLQAAIQIRSQHPDVGVLVLSQSPDERSALTLIDEGGRQVGYLHKNRVGDVTTFVDAIARVARGESAVDRDVVGSLLQRMGGKKLLRRLKPREQAVLALMAEGRTDDWIALSLRITVGAAEQHAAQVFEKLGLDAVPDETERVPVLLKKLGEAPANGRVSRTRSRAERPETRETTGSHRLR